MSDFEIYNGDVKKTLKMFRKDNVFLVFIILLVIVLAIFITSIMMFYDYQQNTDKIQPGVFIKDINKNKYIKLKNPLKAFILIFIASLSISEANTHQKKSVLFCIVFRSQHIPS